VLSWISRLLRLASVLISLIVIASFTIFAVDQTKNASVHQQEQLRSESPTASSSAPQRAGTSTGQESGLHKAVDEASGQLTSPFSGIVSASSGEWALRSVNLLLALIVYGFGLGYLARVLRIRTGSRYGPALSRTRRLPPPLSL
jgi:hypothetical protein